MSHALYMKIGHEHTSFRKKFGTASSQAKVLPSQRVFACGVYWATHSISTRAPNGSALTATVERAG
jgi:hypothetical protein